MIQYYTLTPRPVIYVYPPQPVFTYPGYVPLKTERPPSPVTTIAPKIIANTYAQTDDRLEREHNIPLIIVEPPTPSQHEEEDVDVTDEFVQDCNDHYVAKKGVDRALKMMVSLRKMGGLDAGNPAQKDVARARIGLVMLAGLKDREVKEKALNAIKEILEGSHSKSNDAERLYDFAERFGNLFVRKAYTEELIPIQELMNEILTSTVNRMLSHFSKKHANAISTPIKEALIKATLLASRSNRKEDMKIMFWGSMAREASLRLQDDKSELGELAKGVGQGISALMSMFFFHTQPTIDIPQNLSGVVEGIEVGDKDHWYDALMFIRELGNMALNDMQALDLVQFIITRIGNAYNWRFLYGSVDVLAKIAFKGQTEGMRKQALLGNTVSIRNVSVKVDGLQDLSLYSRLHKHFYMSRLIHFEGKLYDDANWRIRYHTAERLVEIAKKGDDVIKPLAVNIIKSRYETETVKEIKNIFKPIVTPTFSLTPAAAVVTTDSPGLVQPMRLGDITLVQGSLPALSNGYAIQDNSNVKLRGATIPTMNQQQKTPAIRMVMSQFRKKILQESGYPQNAPILQRVGGSSDSLGIESTMSSQRSEFNTNSI